MAIGITYIGGDATAYSSSPPSSYTRTFSIPITIHKKSMVRIAAQGTNYGLSISDTQGNTYTQRGGTNIWVSTLTTTLTPSDTITITLTKVSGLTYGGMLMVVYALEPASGTTLYEFPIANSTSPPGVQNHLWASSSGGTPPAGASGTAAVLEFTGRAADVTGLAPPITVTQTYDANHTALVDVSQQIFSGSTFIETDHINIGYRLYSVPSQDTGTCSISFSGGALSEVNVGFMIFSLPNLGGPWILAPRRGGYHITYAKDGAIYYKTSQTPGKPTFGPEIAVTTGTTDSEPRMVDTGRQGRLYIVFSRGSDCYLTSSDGDGESGTWSTPTLLFSGLKHPTIAYDARNGMLWLGAYEASTGKIKVSVIQPIGSPPSTAIYAQDNTGADLSGFDDDTFHVAPAYEGGGRWQLIAMKSGSATVWQSVDDGASFKQVV